MAGLDLDVVRHALQVARKKGFAEVEIETDGARFSATLEKVKTKAQSSGKSASALIEDLEEKPAEICSSLVGYFNSAKTPLEVGKSVTKGDVVAVISALGLANEVETPYSGEIVEVLVSDGEPVEYGQPIARVKVTT